MGKSYLGFVGLLLGAGCSEAPISTEEPLGSVRSAVELGDALKQIVTARSNEIVTDLAGYDYVGPDCKTNLFIAFASYYKGINKAVADQRMITLEADPTQVWGGRVVSDKMPCLFAMPLMARMYAHPTTYGNMSQPARDAVRSMLLRFVNERSKFADANIGSPDFVDTWKIHMSENIDAMLKSTYLLVTNSLRISHDGSVPGTPNDGVKLADQRTLLEHQSAWRNYWKEYFKRRAQTGINTEYASAVYSKHTLSAYYNVRDLCGSSIVRDLAEKFLTLYWADVAQDFQPTTGVRGGAQARVYRGVYAQTGNEQTGLRPTTWLYGWHGGQKDWTKATQYTTLFPASSTYRIPDVVNAVAKEPSKQVFAYISRRPGIQLATTTEIVSYDPPGSELGLTNFNMEWYQLGSPGGSSGQRRFTFHTPDYVYGILKVTPINTYLNRQHRWMGVTFPTGPNERIAVYGRGTGYGGPTPPEDPDELRGYAEILGDAGHNVMVVAKDPSASANDGTRIFISNAIWSTREEDSGWLFVRSGNGWAAIKALSSYENPVVPTDYGVQLELLDEWSPIVIQLAQASDYPSFAAFKQDVTDNQLTFSNQELVYVSNAGETYKIRRGENYTNNLASYVLPSVNGMGSVDPAKTYSSPYIQGFFNQNTVQLLHPDHPTTVLDFNY